MLDWRMANSSAELEAGDTGYNYEGGDKGYTQVKGGD